MNDYVNVIRHHYADFSGRARRREYWMFALINAVISFSLVVLDSTLGWSDEGLSGGVITIIYSLVTLIPTIAVTVRRLHDIGRSDWWLLIIFIPLLGAIVLFVFTVMDSQPGANKWGPNPKGQANVWGQAAG